MVHTLESFAAKQHNRVTRLFAREAFRLIIRALPCLKDDPTNLDKRLDLLLGAYYAGISLFNSGSGIAGGLSYPLGVHYSVPHGIVGGVFCLGVVAYNIRNGYYDYAELADSLGMGGPSQDPKAKSEELLNCLQGLFDRLGVPRKLSSFKIDRTAFPHLLEICGGLQGAFDQNPVPFSVSHDLPEFLENYF
jgi:alcohol dehydrogenase class IV